MCFSIGDFAYVLYVLPGQVSEFDIFMCGPNLEISFFHLQIGNLDLFAKRKLSK